MAGFWLISERGNLVGFGRICNKTGSDNLVEPRMDTNQHKCLRPRFQEFSRILPGVIQSVLIREIRVCKVNDSWSVVSPSIKVSAACAIYSERAFSSSPRDAGVGRRPRRGETSQIVPPLPGPTAIELSELRQDRSA